MTRQLYCFVFVGETNKTLTMKLFSLGEKRKLRAARGSGITATSRRLRVATRGGCFAAARAACVSTWLGEYVNKNLSSQHDARLKIWTGRLAHTRARSASEMQSCWLDKTITITRFHLTRCLSTLRARLPRS